MLRLLADENLNHDLIRGVRRRLPWVDFARAQDQGLRNADDRAVLAHAAEQRRVVVTHDANTMPAFAFERIRSGQPMPGLFIVSQQAAMAALIDDLVLLVECSDDNEWAGRVLYLPLR